MASSNVFDEESYLQRNPDVAQAVANGSLNSGLQHWASLGWAEGRTPQITFEEDFYLGYYPDVAAAVATGSFSSGLEHYAMFGANEGRASFDSFDQPGSFNEENYLQRNPDVAQAVANGSFKNGFQHWANFGWAEGRVPQITFEENFYLDTYPDVAGAVTNGFFPSGLAHYTMFGASEGRSPIPNQTLDWGGPQLTVKPDSLSDEVWETIWSNFTQSVGTDVAQYQSLLAENAAYLSQIGETGNDVFRLLTFELLKASNFGSVIQRHAESVFGKGQVFPWDISVTPDGNGNVTLNLAGTSRSFALQSDGSYLEETGGNGILTQVDGVYQLGERDGSKTVFRPNGLFDYVEDANGNRIQATYTDDRLSEISYTNGDRLTFAYNDQGRISAITDQAGRVTTYNYDANGEYLVDVSTPEGTISYTYITDPGASLHAIESITYPDGSQSLFEYDSQGRLSRQSLNDGAEAINYNYDSTGGVTITDANGAVTRQFMNSRGQTAQIIDPLNRAIQYRYDGDDNLTQIVAPGNTVSSFNYDADGNLVSASNPLGHRVNYTYEPNFNQLASVSDPKGNAIGYGYDNRGNLINITYADGSSETFGYDSNGNLTVSANRRGQTLQYTYDPNFRLIQKDYPDGSSATFTYDDRGNLLTATDGDSSTSFAYDSNDRLIQVTDSDGRFLSYTYDDIGRRTQMADSLGNQVNYSYDSLGRLSRLTDGSNNLIASYMYDAAGQLSRNDNGNSTYTTYSYDPAGQLISLVNYKADGSVNSRFDYTYNELGQQTAKTTLEGTTNYGYDASGQLTSVNLPDGRSIQYEYDEAGNRIKVTDSGTSTDYSTNSLNQYTAVGGAAYRYDSDGNLIEKTEAGNTSTYIYDAENRLVGVTTPDGSWSYEYDALGNRVATVRNGERTEYLLDPIGLGNVVAEFDESGNLVANYVHGLGLESHTREGLQAFYDFDAIGSVTGLTGDTGDYLNQYSYLPFGENLTKTESIANPFEYVGQWGVMNEENGLEFMRARFYDSQDGRFTQPDPIGIFGKDLNLYRYSINNPVNLLDPSGLLSASDSGKWIKRVSDAVIIGADKLAKSLLEKRLTKSVGIYSVGVDIYNDIRNKNTDFWNIVKRGSQLVLAKFGGPVGSMLALGLDILDDYLPRDFSGPELSNPIRVTDNSIDKVTVVHMYNSPVPTILVPKDYPLPLPGEPGFDDPSNKDNLNGEENPNDGTDVSQNDLWNGSWAIERTGVILPPRESLKLNDREYISKTDYYSFIPGAKIDSPNGDFIMYNHEVLETDIKIDSMYGDRWYLNPRYDVSIDSIAGGVRFQVETTEDSETRTETWDFLGSINLVEQSNGLYSRDILTKQKIPNTDIEYVRSETESDLPLSLYINEKNGAISDDLSDILQELWEPSGTTLYLGQPHYGLMTSRYSFDYLPPSDFISEDDYSEARRMSAFSLTAELDTLNGIAGNDNLASPETQDALIGESDNDPLAGGEESGFLTNTANSESGSEVEDAIANFITGEAEQIYLSGAEFAQLDPEIDVAEQFAAVSSNKALATSDAYINNDNLFYNANDNKPGFGSGGQFVTLEGAQELEANEFIL